MNLKTVSEFIQVLSFLKIAQLSVLILIILAAWFTWTYRSNLYSSARFTAISNVNEPVIIETSPKSKHYIENILARSKDTIAGIHIINVNFTNNTRSTSYFGITDENLKKAVEYYNSRMVSQTPLFNENPTNNKRIVELINGNFICTPFEETLAVIIYRRATGHVKTMCSVSIPPYYGQFSGYLVIYLKYSPTGSDLEFIKQLSKELALMIYDHDVLKNAKDK